MIAALNRFISRSIDRCRPFYLLINKCKGFKCFEDCVVAFQQLKEYLPRPPIMSHPEVDEVLYAYIFVALHAVSLILIRDDNDVQKPVYYVSKSLHEAEVKYLPLEKAILVVVDATRKLPHYFQAYTVVVLTRLPLKSVLRTANYTGRITKWNTILRAFDIKYMPRTSIKGQVLADLMVEFAKQPVEMLSEKISMDERSVGTISVPGPPSWKVYVDGTTNQRGSRVGLVLVSFKESVIEKFLRLGFSATNNEAEYEALLQWMSWCRKWEESLWLFAQWGLDIVSPFPKALGNKKYLLVATDYFTKWVEAEPLANIRDVEAKKFLWRNIISRFGVPHTLISDNGLQFDNKAFRRYCCELRITNRYSTPAYPQGNGQGEVVNKVIVNRLKKRLDDAKGR
ncbi:uncharacterized protein LOC136068329 [Quercus suber]|uniref:uncharacterized protein LOC136068329 n=1 Tax=Quercus suber TaxID=58331 RepID=UPI0032DF5346